MFCQVVQTERERQEFKELNLCLAWVCNSITQTQSSSRNSLSLVEGSNIKNKLHVSFCHFFPFKKLWIYSIIKSSTYYNSSPGPGPYWYYRINSDKSIVRWELSLLYRCGVWSWEKAAHPKLPDNEQDLKTNMLDSKVGGSYWHPMSSRLDVHVC